MQSRFEKSLISNQRAYDLKLSPETVQQLSAYYNLLTHWNERLHLVAPCDPEEFATRHVLESLVLLEYLPQEAKIADIGSGGGLPVIPCLIARGDLQATLIESSQKKAIFLREALHRLNRTAAVVAQVFEQVETPHVSFVTSRALDQFTKKLPALIKWAPEGSTLLLFGGEKLREELNSIDLEFKSVLLPLSEKRFLFSVSL